jgi:hypothetical protein
VVLAFEKRIDVWMKREREREREINTFNEGWCGWIVFELIKTVQKKRRNSLFICLRMRRHKREREEERKRGRERGES